MVPSLVEGFLKTLTHSFRTATRELNVNRFRKRTTIVDSGAASSWSINNLGPQLAENNDSPGFILEHFVKDIGLSNNRFELDHLFRGTIWVHT